MSLSVFNLRSLFFPFLFPLVFYDCSYLVFWMLSCYGQLRALPHLVYFFYVDIYQCTIDNI